MDLGFVSVATSALNGGGGTVDMESGELRKVLEVVGDEVLSVVGGG